MFEPGAEPCKAAFRDDRITPRHVAGKKKIALPAGLSIDAEVDLGLAQGGFQLAARLNVNLPGMLQILRKEYKVRTVACEGGPTLFRALLEQGLIDRLNLTIAPYMFGGVKAPTLTGVSKDFLPASVHCSLSDMRIIGNECFLTYRIERRRRN